MVDGDKLRRLSINEIKRLFGFPPHFKVDVNNSLAYELFGNSKINKFDFIPGKGRLVLNYLDKNPNQYEILYHNYSLVLKKL